MRLLEPADFAGFLRELSGGMLEALRVNRIRLMIETNAHDAEPTGFDDVLSIVPQGAVDRYISGGRDIALRSVTMRQISSGEPEVFGDNASYMKSECLLKLDLGVGQLPGLLVLGSEDPHQFRSGQGSDLLNFFAATFERVLRRWMA